MPGNPDNFVFQARLRRKKALEQALKELADRPGLAAYRRRLWLRSQIAKLEYSLQQRDLYSTHTT